MNDAHRVALRIPSTRHRVPGFERSPVPYVRKRVTGLVGHVQVDRYGNATAIERGRQERPRLVRAALLDEIGLIV